MYLLGCALWCTEHGRGGRNGEAAPGAINLLGFARENVFTSEGKKALCSAMLGRQYISASFLKPLESGHGETHQPTDPAGSEPELSGMLAKKSTREAAGKKEGRCIAGAIGAPPMGPGAGMIFPLAWGKWQRW